jgi:uncharacterized protein YjbI with pentapeptide repeats
VKDSALARRLKKLLDDEAANYPTAPSTPPRLVDPWGRPAPNAANFVDPIKLREQLTKNFEETTKEARNVFLIHTSLVAYAMLALANIQDRDFFVGPGTKLPVIDVTMSASWFFLLLPFLATAVNLYLHLYLGYVRRFRRLLTRQRAEAYGAQPHDLLFPWIGTLVEQAGLFGSCVRVAFLAIVWCATPIVLFLYWVRVLFLRAGPRDLLKPYGTHVVPAMLVGIAALALLGVLLTWSSMRRGLDHRFTLGTPGYLKNVGWTWRVALWLGAASIVVAEPWWFPSWCDDVPTADGTDMHGTHRGPDFLCVANLAGAQLSQTRPSGPPLGVALAGANLRGANMPNSFLDGADLTGATLTGATLKGASLKGAHLEHAALEGSHLEGAQLQGAYFSEPFGGADASFARARDEPTPPSGRLLHGNHDLSLSAARMSWVHLDDAQMQGAYLEGVKLYGAHLAGSQLQGAQMAMASLEKADLTAAQLQGSTLTRAILERATLRQARLDGADLSATYLAGADFSRASLRGATLRLAQISGDTTFRQAGLQGTDLRCVRGPPPAGPGEHPFCVDGDEDLSALRDAFQFPRLDDPAAYCGGIPWVRGQSDTCTPTSMSRGRSGRCERLPGGGNLDDLACSAVRASALRKVAGADRKVQAMLDEPPPGLEWLRSTGSP